LIFVLLLGTFKGIKLQFDFSLWKKMLGYTLPLVLVGFCAVFNKEAGYLFLKYLLGDSVEEARGVIGIFSANVKLAVIMSLFTQAYNYAIEPFFFNNKHREDNRQLYADSTMLYTMVTSIAFVAILGFLPILKFIIRNEEMYEGLGVVPFLLFAYILLGIYYNLSVWFKLTDRTIYASIIAISGSVVTGLVAILTIPTWSYYGVALAALACYLVMVSLSYFWGQRYYKIPYRVGRMGLYLLMAVVVNGGRKMIVDMTQPSFTVELLYGLITVVLFILIVWQLDRKFLTGLLSRK
jgi:O-antigen/teichoic acid export membrane protein